MRITIPTCCFPNKHFSCFIFSCFITSLLIAQKTDFVRQKSKEPSWIKMMDDSNVNYNEAVVAFEAYWKGRVTPIEEDELFATEGKEEKEKELREKKQKKMKADDPAIVYAVEFKRFKQWQREMVPFVKPDGSIKTMDERMTEWKQQQRDKNDYQFKPKKTVPVKKNN